LAGSLEEACYFRVNLRSFGNTKSEISDQTFGEIRDILENAMFLLVVEPKSKNI